MMRISSQQRTTRLVPHALDRPVQARSFKQDADTSPELLYVSLRRQISDAVTSQDLGTLKEILLFALTHFLEEQGLNQKSFEWLCGDASQAYLWYATLCGNVGAVRLLTVAENQSLTKSTLYHSLFLAVWLGHTDIASVLLSAGAPGSPFLLKTAISQKNATGQILLDYFLRQSDVWQGHVCNSEALMVGSSPWTVSSANPSVLSETEGQALKPQMLSDVPWENRIQAARAQIMTEVFLLENVCCRDVLEALSHCSQLDALATRAARGIVQEAWKAVRWPYTIDLTLAVFYLICLGSVTAAMESGEYVDVASVPIILMISITTKDAIEETLQMISTMILYEPTFARTLDGLLSMADGRAPALRVGHRLCRGLWSYLVKASTLTDWLRIALDYIGIAILCRGTDQVERRALLGLWCMSRWIRVLVFLRGYTIFGTRILPILHALVDTSSFFVLICFCIAAVVHLYYIAGVRGADEKTPLYVSFLTIYSLGVLGESHLEEMEHEALSSFVVVQVVFLLTTLLISVLMMNVLIGILGSNYERFEDHSIMIFVRERAKIVCNYSDRFWLDWSCCWPALPRRLPRGTSHYLLDDKVETGPYLWIASKAELTPESQRSARTVTYVASARIIDEVQELRQELGSITALMQNVCLKQQSDTWPPQESLEL